MYVNNTLSIAKENIIRMYKYMLFRLFRLLDSDPKVYTPVLHIPVKQLGIPKVVFVRTTKNSLK